MNETRMKVLADQIIGGGSPLPLLGAGHFSKVFDLGDGTVLKVSGPGGFGSDDTDYSYSGGEGRAYDGWQAYAPWRMAHPDPHFLPVLAYHQIDDLHAVGIVPRAKPMTRYAGLYGHVRLTPAQELQTRRLTSLMYDWTGADSVHNWRNPPKWARELKAWWQPLRESCDLDLDLHEGNVLHYQGRMVYSDPFGVSRAPAH